MQAFRNLFKNDLVLVGTNLTVVAGVATYLGSRVEKKLDHMEEEQEARMDEIEGTLRGHIGLIEDSLDRIEGKPNGGKQDKLYNERTKDAKGNGKGQGTISASAGTSVRHKAAHAPTHLLICVVIGSEAWQLPPVGHPDRPKNVPDDHTKRWTVYVRVPDGDPDIRAWLNKVSFKIFNTYENPLRMVEKPPFEVTETGWGGFNIDIRLHFQPISGEKAQYRQHFLQLEKYGDEKMQAEQERTGCVRSEFLEVVQFNEPTEALFDALTSEDQWNYLIPAGKGGSKKASLGANGRMRRGLPNGERSAQLPEKGGDEVPFSQEQEQALQDFFKQKMDDVEKQLDKEAKRKEEVEAKLKALRSELGHEAAQQAAQQASGDRSRRR
ncbi:uncharacterized protein ALTATR162_LOCUS5315 [Alternaria atra]|uniref:Protein AF-9 homolog n=1 Tax=Alternaria atra TaxID=119953 RepID=A0A8J2HZY2_9PLEO|nr:uncharacterized protein ALTATR162_LOCUS5315 [Alternaria atra]CAG5158912.1 unnamed protein product [Alternaria atra]